jgi:hypothetical protein
MNEPEEPSDQDPHLLLKPGQAVVVVFNKEDVYLAGEIADLDRIGILISCYWKTEEGIQHTQDSYVPWTTIESVDLYGSIKASVRTVWTLLAAE